MLNLQLHSEITVKKTFAALALATALIPFSSAQADVISYTANKAMTTTNWSDFFSFNKFDSSLGTLTGITFDLTGIVRGTAAPKAWMPRRRS